MATKSFPNDVNGIFKAVFDRAYDGPISEIDMYKALSATELFIRRSLDSKEEELGGLRVGYLWSDPNNPEEMKMYWVGWGYHPSYELFNEKDNFDEAEIFSQTVDYAPFDQSNVGFLKQDLAETLLDALNQWMDTNKKREIYPFLMGHTVKVLKDVFSSSATTPETIKVKPGLKPQIMRPAEEASASPHVSNIGVSTLLFWTCNCGDDSSEYTQLKEPGRPCATIPCKRKKK